MSSPADFYKSLPPVSRAYGTICVLTTALATFGLLDPWLLILDTNSIFKKLQLWRLLTNFFYLGTFSIPFGMQILMIARYGVQLERGAYDKRTADFVWMLMLAMGTIDVIALLVPALNFRAMGTSLVFMLVYLWSREFATAQVSIAGLVTLQGFYLPWALLALNTLFGHSPWAVLLGSFVGHAYYFFNALYPRQSGRDVLRTPLWVHRLVAKWDRAGPQYYTPASVPPPVPGGVFAGRAYRLNRD